MPCAALKTFAGLAGFAQFGLGVALLLITSIDMQRDGQDSCVYGRSYDFSLGAQTCDALAWLSLITIASSLIISVTQGACSLVLRFPPRCVEVLVRIGLVGCWTGLAIITTIATIKSDHVDHQGHHRHWRHVGLVLAWVQAGLAAVFASTALLGLCCVDLPLLACCCCCPCCLPQRHHQDIEWAVYDPLSSHWAWSCLDALGLLWLFDRLWPARVTASEAVYQPLSPNECWAPSMQLQQQQQQRYPNISPEMGPHAASEPVYLPPVIMEAAPSQSYPPSFPHVHTPQERPQPLMAPVYAPFSHGPLPPTVGWGVPVERPPAGAIHPPHGAPRPPVPPSHWQHQRQQQHRYAPAYASGYAGGVSSEAGPSVSQQSTGAGPSATIPPGTGGAGSAYPIPTAAWWPDDGATPRTSMSEQPYAGHEQPSAPPKGGYEPPSAPPKGG